MWGGSEALRGAADAVRWPFERAAWAIERALIWPLEERTGDWSGALRSIGIAAMVLTAAAAGVFGLIWMAGGGGGATQSRTAASSPAPSATRQVEASEPAAPFLRGAAPDFTPEADVGSAKASAPNVDAVEATTGTASTGSPSASASTSKESAGPAAIEVARRFAGAFVLYETGVNDSKVRTIFGETATPRLTKALLRRPPRLPANVEVPRAKVLNVVPGPQHGDTYTLSVSLLRVGITNELRIEMQRDEKSGEWRVMDVRG